MTDIDAMCANLNQQECCKSMGGPGVHPPGCGECPRDIAAALDRMRDELAEARAGRASALAGLDAEGKAHWAAQDKLTAAEAEVARLREALLSYTSYPCPACSGDCEGAEPPMLVCPTQLALKALAQRSE